MTYQEWADEYDHSVAVLKGSIAKLREEAKGQVSAAVLKDLQYRISVLQTMCYECMRTANELRKRKGEC